MAAGAAVNARIANGDNARQCCCLESAGCTIELIKGKWRLQQDGSMDNQATKHSVKLFSWHVVICSFEEIPALPFDFSHEFRSVDSVPRFPVRCFRSCYIGDCFRAPVYVCVCGCGGGVRVCLILVHHVPFQHAVCLNHAPWEDKRALLALFELFEQLCSGAAAPQGKCLPQPCMRGNRGRKSKRDWIVQARTSCTVGPVRRRSLRRELSDRRCARKTYHQRAIFKEDSGLLLYSPFHAQGGLSCLKDVTLLETSSCKAARCHQHTPGYGLLRDEPDVGCTHHLLASILLLV